MSSSLATGIVAISVVLAGFGFLLFVRRRWQRRDKGPLAHQLDERLADAMGPGTGSHLECAPTVRQIATVGGDADEGTDRSIIVPVVRIDLETTDAPGMKLILEYVADVLEVIHPELEARDEHVAHYDVEFTFGPNGLLVEGECRRVSVAPALAERLCEDNRFDAFDLWQAVKRADGDDETPTTLWGPCRSASRFASSQSMTDDSRLD